MTGSRPLPRHAFLTGAVLVASAVAAVTTSYADERAAGEREFAAHCAICHGADARGDGPYADKLRRKPKDLTALSAKNRGVFPEELVYEIIDGRRLVVFHGTREMPIWGDSFRAQGDEATVRRRISALVAYLKSRQSE